VKLEQKKIAAALAAVQAFLHEEAAKTSASPIRQPVASFWGLSGRLEQMNLRSLFTSRVWK